MESEDEAGSARAMWRTVTLVVMALAGAATLVALIWTLGEANRQRDRALNLQAHSYRVMILARTLAGTIARSEASLGRYVISGDKQLGRLYFDEWTRAGAEIDRLDLITNDNTAQQPQIDRLRAAYEARGKQLSLTALSTNYKLNRQAFARFYAAGRASELTEINDALDRIIDREHVLLDARTTEAMGSVDRSSRIAGGLAVFGILLVLGAIALGWLTLRAVGERVRAEADADAERARAQDLAAAVAQATEELHLQEAKLRQAQKMDALGQLTGGIAHDFNNMLAVVLGGLELAARACSDDAATIRRHLESATEGANRAAALTRRLLAFSREESLKPEPLRLGALIDGMADLLDRTLGDAVTLVRCDDGGDWRVMADRVQLENAVLNLAVNARDAMNERGTLTIATGRTVLEGASVGACAAGEYVTLAIGDSGCGMTPEVAERVFEPFFTTKAAGKGTGLGLSQIFGLVRQLDGEIAISTAPGEGTTVTLYLPRDASDQVDMAEPDETVRETPSHAGLSVLVVEDDPRVLGATIGALEELGHMPIACDDPLKAAPLIAACPAIDLVISDVLMPGLTGPEMIAGLSRHHPHLAVLFVTGYAGEAGAREFGSHRVLRKPFTLVGLETAIGDAMASERPAPPARLAAE